MKLRILVFALFGVILMLSSCSPKHSEIIVSEFGNHKIRMDEFEKAYAESVGGIKKVERDSLKKLENYLELYTNYKMKLRDAQVRGITTDKTIENEIKEYRKKLGASYIIEKQLVAPALEVLYQRRKTELRVSHILIRKDSIGEKAAIEKAEKIIADLKKGADFSELAQKYSEDQRSSQIGGDVYYVTAGIILPNFEDAIYSIKEGEVYDKPLLSQIAAHVVKVTEVRKRKEEVDASHIMIKTTTPPDIEDTTALIKAKEVLAKLKAGADFGELAKEYSDDPGSAKNNGTLGFFGRGRMVRPFEEAAFDLDEGKISSIVRTRYGYHIIKANKIKYPGTFEEEKEAITKLYKANGYKIDHEEFLSGLKAKKNFSENIPNINIVGELLDTVRVSNYLETSQRKNVKDLVLYSYDSTEVITDSLLQRTKRDLKHTTRFINAELIKAIIKGYSEQDVLEEEALSLDKRDKEFAKIMEDYKSGVYIFAIQEREIWNNVGADSAGVEKFYQENKEKYRWNDRVDFYEINSKNEDKINKLYKQVEDGADIEMLASSSTERKGYQKLGGHFNMVDVNTNEVSTKAFSIKEREISKPFKLSDGSWSFVKVNKKEKSRIKTLEEAYIEVSSAYQDRKTKELEEKYLKKLNDVYQPKLYKEELQEAFIPELK